MVALLRSFVLITTCLGAAFDLISISQALLLIGIVVTQESSIISVIIIVLAFCFNGVSTAIVCLILLIVYTHAVNIDLEHDLAEFKNDV